MKNQLISDNVRRDYKVLNGVGYPEERCSGRSTGIVLGMLSEAMANPGKWIKGRDHVDKWIIREMSIRHAREIIRKLNLSFFEFRKDSLRYNIFGED